ncbi:hypothetical protein [Culicoidibacter larvae]|uniref:Uncharacterized protein n=1 Tax=Culicoidibacter larvae TaxID=2579976 RepID=A0A5R8QDB4_9FIRM|nr:hypothetical protein [Culicoidibacter larvae]TLG75255.1 hypothetical protein FEZ08_04205 [Culicoidibacter larvae]
MILNEFLPEPYMHYVDCNKYANKDKLFFFLPNGLTKEAKTILGQWFAKDRDVAVLLIGENIDVSDYQFAYVIDRPVEQSGAAITDRSNIVRYYSEVPDGIVIERTLEQLFSNIGCGLSKEF